MYLYIQNQLGGTGRFLTSGNVLRYIISDIEGMKLIINLIHGKLKTPKYFVPSINFTICWKPLRAFGTH
jgi:hypothetical protein